jgi:hypothetical protein
MKRKVLISILFIFFLLMGLITIVVVRKEQDRLPLVELDLPRTDFLSINYEKEAWETYFDETTDVFISLFQFDKDEYSYLFPVGEKVSLEIQERSETGTVQEIRHEATYDEVLVSFKSSLADEDIKSVKVLAKFDFTSNSLDRLIPLEYVHFDDVPPYVFLLRQEKGPWGYEYYVEQVSLTDYISDSQYLYPQNLEIKLPIISSCEAPLGDGLKVRIYP